MHSRLVSEQWRTLESTARSPLWRAVDVLITVYGEPLDVIRRTAEP